MRERQFSRVIVVAPTRSTCINIHTALENTSIPPTLLMQHKRLEIDEAISNLALGGYGIMAGTGVGKTVAIGDLCRKVLRTDLVIDIVTREFEATVKTWQSNVVVITPGVAVHWLKASIITPDDLMVFDEIHQTSDHIELSLALAKRAGCTFVWMSATIDPDVYLHYLNARTVICCEATDPDRRATIEVKQVDVDKQIAEMMEWVVRESRGVAVFVPTRAMAESLAREFDGRPDVQIEFYHGGESAQKLRPFLTGDVPKPFIVFMTNAGASSLNIVGLDTVVIVDQWYTGVLQSGGVLSLEKHYLGPNEILQAGGRVNGRAINGKIFILTDREVDFHSLQPVTPQFVLGGSLRELALTCARMEIDVRELDLIGQIDFAAFDREVDRFVERGLIVKSDMITLSELGQRVESLPVDPAWAEMLVAVMDQDDQTLFEIVVVMACTEQLYKLVRREWNRFCREAVLGSDHMTAYNIVATALRQFGYIDESASVPEYSLRGDWQEGLGEQRRFGEFAGWAHQQELVATEIRNILLAMKSIYRRLNRPLPSPDRYKGVCGSSKLFSDFVELLARVQSLDFVYNKFNSTAGPVIISKGSMASDQSTLGSIRFWQDDHGNNRASIEGTIIPKELVDVHTRLCVKSVLGMSEDGQRVRVRFAKTFADEPQVSGKCELNPSEVPKIASASLPKTFARWLAIQMI